MWDIVYSSLYGKEDEREIDRNPPGGSPGASVAVPAYTHTHNIYIYSAHGIVLVYGVKRKKKPNLWLLTTCWRQQCRDTGDAKHAARGSCISIYIWVCVCASVFRRVYFNHPHSHTARSTREIQSNVYLYQAPPGITVPPNVLLLYPHSSFVTHCSNINFTKFNIKWLNVFQELVVMSLICFFFLYTIGFG